jgi:hypothetical protein
VEVVDDGSTLGDPDEPAADVGLLEGPADVLDVPSPHAPSTRAGRTHDPTARAR